MLLTLRQAEQITGYSSDTLRRKIKDGSIPTVWEKNRYMIDEKDLVGYAKKPSKRRVHEQSHVEREVPEGTNFMGIDLPDNVTKVLLAYAPQAKLALSK